MQSVNLHTFCLGELRWPTVNLSFSTTNLIVSCLTITIFTSPVETDALCISLWARVKREYHDQLKDKAANVIWHLGLPSMGDHLRELGYLIKHLFFHWPPTSRLCVAFRKTHHHIVHIFLSTELGTMQFLLSGWLGLWIASNPKQTGYHDGHTELYIFVH